MEDRDRTNRRDGDGVLAARHPGRARLVHSGIERAASGVSLAPPSGVQWGAVPCRSGARSHAATTEPRAGAASFRGKGASRPVSRVLYGAEGEPAARDDHSSGAAVAGRLERSTRATARKRVGRRVGPAAARPVAPIRSYSRWGLPCRRRCRLRGALLPHPFTLTRTGDRSLRRAVCFLWRFPWGRPRRTLSGTVFPWSPDFPPRSRAAAVRPAGPPCVEEVKPKGKRVRAGPRQTSTGCATRPAVPKTRR